MLWPFWEVTVLLEMALICFTEGLAKGLPSSSCGPYL